ncbi:MAG: hypothetical protein PHC37_06975 [Candidatus Omnitrophica bacterium]|jgi:hypothetical protein|nr:hypothetical protein [Candidatus Omnitrophota bacterium]MDD5691416.1 hypothetical protein [Candidatus Omnitrophota bacterium]
MDLGNKVVVKQKIIIIFGILLALGFISIAIRGKHVKMLIEKVDQQALIIKEKDKQLETDKIQYTSLAARLHKEVKRVGELEEELKKYKRGR